MDLKADLDTRQRESKIEAGTQAVLDEGTTAGMSNSIGVERGQATAVGYGGQIY